MLLNQCLAISLSPLTSACSASNGLHQQKEKIERCCKEEKQASGAAEVEEQKSNNEHEVITATIERNHQKQADTRDKKTIEELKQRQWSKLNLFHQLIELNLTKCNNSYESERFGLERKNIRTKRSASSTPNDDDNENIEEREEEFFNETREKGEKSVYLTRAQLELNQALTRIEFAGFVVPNWLLLSGTYDDLHCIKSSWSDGNFKAPSGFAIETIGKWKLGKNMILV